MIIEEIKDIDYFHLLKDGVIHENANFIFKTGNCLLMEYFTGKSYSYSALNIYTKKSKHLFHQKNKLTKNKYSEIAGRIILLPLNADGPPENISENNSDKKMLQEQSQKEKLEESLEHIFNNIFPIYGYTKREKQIELANQMLTGLLSRSVSLSEAEVGTGKTHAYIIAALLVKLSGLNDFYTRSNYPLTNHFHSDTPMPIVISTVSIALQKAIIDDYIPQISQMLMDFRMIKKPLTFVIRKGKEHYICDRRLNNHIHSLEDDLQQQFLKLNKADFLHIDLDSSKDLTDFSKRKINVNNQCSNKCTMYEKCRYIKFLNFVKLGKHDFQVCNHNYLLADTIRRSKNQEPLIPNYECLIIDESHKFLQAARQMYGCAFSNIEILHLVAYISKLKFVQQKMNIIMPSYTDRLLVLNKEFFTAIFKSILKTDDDTDDCERFKIDITKKAIAVLSSIIRCLNDIEVRLSESQVDYRQASLYSFSLYLSKELRERIKIFNDVSNIVYWLEIPKISRNTNENILCSIPVSMNEMLCNDLWNKRVPIILTSGTLSVGGCFSHIKKNMGLDLIKNKMLMETSKPSPFNYKENYLLYISECVPFPNNNNSNYVKSIADEITKLIKATHGHTAILFTSYKVMSLVYNIVENRNIGFPFFKLAKGAINTIDDYKKSKNGVLFASGSMWEGIDIPGDVLSSLIIVKLPFAVPDPIGDYEQTLYESAFEYKKQVIVPEMIIKLKQGFGRLIRHITDTGVVSILDFRVRKGQAYRKIVLDSLPDCRVTNAIVDVMEFIKAKKDKNYFEGDNR